MKHWTIGIVLILYYHTFYAQKDVDIIWNKSYKLKWEDFQGKPNRNSPGGAATSSGIGRRFIYKNDKIIIEIRAVFDKKKSWVKDDDKIPSTLEHEQLHFDITELYARKFRKAILETKFKKKGKKAEKKFLKISTKIEEEKNAYQSLFDRETTNPRDEVKQKEWVEKVAKELAELEDYTYLEIVIDLNKKRKKK